MATMNMKHAITSPDEKQKCGYRNWKEFADMGAYYWLYNFDLKWASTSCRWGPIVSQPAPYVCRQRVYLIEQHAKAKAGIFSVDWNHHDEWKILTGSADQNGRLYDRRKLESGKSRKSCPIVEGTIFQGHTGAVCCVQWCPGIASVFASASEDGLLALWDLKKVFSHVPVFKHLGHMWHRNKMVDLQWNQMDPQIIASLSEDAEGGGTIQVWQTLDWIGATNMTNKKDVTSS